MPDVVILVYNDHASEFSLDSIRRSRSAVPNHSPPRRGIRPAPGASVAGTPNWPGHIAITHSGRFDITILNRLNVDHGLTARFTDVSANRNLAGQVHPVLVNAVPVPRTTGNRCGHSAKHRPRGAHYDGT